MSPSPTPNPIDLHVGARLRLKRKGAGLSQAELAAALDVSFQQIQKYEKGANRLSASMLYAAATVLRASVDGFFVGLETTVDPVSGHATISPLHDLMSLREGPELALWFARLPIGQARHMLAVIRAFADTEDLSATG